MLNQDTAAPALSGEEPVDREDLDDKDEKKDEPVVAKDIEKYLKARINSSKRNRRVFSADWKRNIELRLGKIATVFTGGIDVEDDIQTEINPDWSLTKTKTANLYSQVPSVQATHENKAYAAAIYPFMKQLNYELSEKRCNVGVAMEECLNDVVNAAGIAGIIVGYAARFETVQVPLSDQMTPGKPLPALPAAAKPAAPPPGPGGPPGPPPANGAAPPLANPAPPALKLPTPGMAGPMPGLAGGAAPPPPAPPPMMVEAQRVVSDKFYAMRVSPSDLLWPSEFVGSNFDDGDWIGYTGRMPWAEAKNEFKMEEEDQDKATAHSLTTSEDDLRSEPDDAGIAEVKNVKYDRIFYWRYRQDPDETSFTAIWELVFVHGIDKPVIHKPWSGQEYDKTTRKYVGSSKFPLRILTLTYITDNPIPPSDSSAGRPQVNDMRRSRSQMFQNRERSIPIRWFDVNRIDPSIQDTLMRGTWQGMIPTNGDGSRSIGEIARASYPAEDMSFDQTAKTDLMDTWQVTPQMMGTTGGKQTKAGVQADQTSFATRIGQERNRVAMHFLSVCEVLAGLMALYSDFPLLSDQEKQTMHGAWDDKHILHDLVMKIRPDSTIVLDSQARIQRLMQFLNMTAKSGYVNIEPIIAEIAELSGLDPAEVVIKPQPKPPEEPNVSYRFTGKEDVNDPLVLAMLLANKKQLPTVEQIDQAKILLRASAMSIQEPAPGAPGQPAPPVGGPSGPHPPGPGAPPSLHPNDVKTNEDHVLASKVAKRSRDI